MADPKLEAKAKSDLQALMAANPGLTWQQLYALLAVILAAFGITLPPLPTASQADVEGVLQSHKINWGNILQIVATILQTLGPILGGLGGAPTGS